MDVSPFPAKPKHCQLRTKRLLTLFNHDVLRTRRALLLYKVSGDSDLLFLDYTECRQNVNTLLANDM